MTPDEVRELYRDGKITLAQARNIIGMWLVMPRDDVASGEEVRKLYFEAQQSHRQDQ